MTDIISLTDFLKGNKIINRAAVTGAGPSLDKHHEEIRRFPVTIGVNYTYKLHPCDFLFVSHGILLFNFFKGIEAMPKNTTVVYPDKMIDFMFRGPKAPPTPGIRYRPYKDLYVGTSTIIPAIHFGCLIADRVTVYGMDLCFTGGNQYAKDYPTKQQSQKIFDEWAEVVTRQLAHMKNHMDLIFLVKS